MPHGQKPAYPSGPEGRALHAAMTVVAEAETAAMDNAVDVWRLETAYRLHCAYGS